MLACIAVVGALSLLVAACGGSTSSRSAGASGSGGPQAQAQVLHDLTKFAGCMRVHGVPDFPDPTTSPRDFKQSLDPTTQRSPASRAAISTCQHLLPEHSMQSQGAPRSPAQVEAMLAFARCIRSHGFPSFPDPTSTGELTHEMVAGAGISLHQPGVLQAGETCAAVTHGVITKAIVARFVAGH
jgi:hypothetical protein